MTDPTAAFARMVPGFDFLQGLVKNAGAALPAVGQWIAPTIDPEELDKRINDLRTVQFWLEQNARMLGATIQALEVQRMTLSTLKTMNVSLGDLTESLKIRLPDPPAETPPPAPAPAMFRTPPPPPPAPEAEAPQAPAEEALAPAPGTVGGVVDPMQWWTALTQQFTQLAASAMKEGASDTARNLAGAMVKQGLDAAGETFRQAAALPAAAAQQAARGATQGAAAVAKGLAGARAPARKAAAKARPAAAAKKTRRAAPR